MSWKEGCSKVITYSILTEHRDIIDSMPPRTTVANMKYKEPAFALQSFSSIPTSISEHIWHPRENLAESCYHQYQLHIKTISSNPRDDRRAECYRHHCTRCHWLSGVGVLRLYQIRPCVRLKWTWMLCFNCGWFDRRKLKSTICSCRAVSFYYFIDRLRRGRSTMSLFLVLFPVFRVGLLIDMSVSFIFPWCGLLEVYIPHLPMTTS